MQLLRRLCSIQATSGNEAKIQEHLLNYIQTEKKNWKVKPEIIHGDLFQHCIILVFGKPRTAVYAHIDNIGFQVRYENQLVKIGGPRTISGYKLVGNDSQ